MLKLIQNEWMKLWATKGSWIMVVFIVLITLFPSVMDQMTDGGEQINDAAWKSNLQMDIANFKEGLAMNPDDAEFYEEQIALAEYRLANNLKPDYQQTTEGYFDYGISLLGVISFFSVIVGASIVSNEFSTGTIKMLLTRPVSRAKVLTSKLATVFIYGLTLYVIALFVSILIGNIMYDASTSPNLVYEAGKVVEKSAYLDSLNTGLYMSVDFVMTILFAFMIGSVFRNSSLAIGLTLIISFMGAMVVVFLSRYEFVKYLWITHSDFTQHKTGSFLVEGITMPLSIAVLIVYAVIFTAISYFVFMKRDITA